MHDDRTPIQATAPLRISFVGGGTDFPHYYEQHGGAVLSATIDRGVRVRIEPRDDRNVRVRSSDLGRTIEYHLDDGPAYDGVMDLAKAAIERVGVRGGVDVAIASDAPPGSGLGGSSALVTAVVAGLAMLGGRAYTDRELAEVSYAIERDDLRISGGWQDQYAAAFGGLNLLAFSAAGTTVEPVRIAPSIREALEANLLLCHSGAVRRHAGLIDTQIRLYEQGREDTILGLKQLHQMAYAMRDAIEAGELDDLGLMLRDAFVAKKQMNPHIAEDTPIESMLALAQAAGATGGKICGAGGGGYLLVYCRPAAQATVRAELERLGARFAPFRFTGVGARAERGAATWVPVRSS
jgi:D-glycero-alpha-D-manno-heptose-7-phosphate kinase